MHFRGTAGRLHSPLLPVGGTLGAEAAPWLGHDLMDSHRSSVVCGPQGPTNPQRPHGTLHGALCGCVAGSGQSTASEVSGTLAAGPASLPSRPPRSTQRLLSGCPPTRPRALRPSGHLCEQAALGLKISMSPVCITCELGRDSVQCVNLSFPCVGPLI